MNMKYTMVVNLPTLKNMLLERLNFGMVVNILADTYEYTNRDIVFFFQDNGVKIDENLGKYIHDFGNDECYSASCTVHC